MEKMTKREKIMIGVGVVCITVAGVIIYKQHGIKTQALLDKAKLTEENKELKDMLIKNIEENKDLKDKVTTLLEAASEGLFEEAIGTVNNKINYRVDKKKFLDDALKLNPNDKQTQKALAKVEIELTNLFGRKEKFIDAQLVYGINDEEI